MTIVEQITNDLNFARKNKESAKITIISTLLSAVKKAGKDKQEEITSDGDAIQVIKKFIKNTEEVKEILSSNNRETNSTDEEIKIYQNYLPKQLTEEEMRNIVKQEIEKLEDRSAKSMGVIMKFFKENHEGCFDGKVASNIVKELLG